jgi:plasmid stabilization system protein ParE
MPSKPVTVHRLAAEEIEQTFDWYQECSAEAARNFLTELRQAFSKIAHSPRQSPVYHQDARKFPFRRFPFLVFYRELQNAIQILASLMGDEGPATGSEEERTPPKPRVRDYKRDYFRFSATAPCS